MFFDACDGFFTNYNWTEKNLELMRDYSEIQDRQADVYVGVDVFARGQVVGGMFDTNKVRSGDTMCLLMNMKNLYSIDFLNCSIHFECSVKRHRDLI